MMNLTREQAQRFCDPIIEFLQRNPNVFNKIRGEIDGIKKQRITAGLGVGEITVEQNPKLQTKSNTRSTDGTLAS